uniref:Si:ch211-215k15.4 n=1 Tax=Fundulus heteroclitus TaxID=8078 RepID=A0A3Q2P4K6_FUNHE
HINCNLTSDNIPMTHPKTKDMVTLLISVLSRNRNPRLSKRYKGGWDAFVDAYNAIDGNRDPDLRKGSCTHTAAHDNPWRRVDLLDSYVVDQISITNRQDCCAERINGPEIHIGNSLKDEGASNPLVATVSSIQGGSNLTIKLSEGVEGRYVTILLPGPSRILTLCEVEVCGYPAPTGKALAVEHPLPPTQLLSKFKYTEM